MEKVGVLGRRLEVWGEDRGYREKVGGIGRKLEV